MSSQFTNACTNCKYSTDSDEEIERHTRVCIYGEGDASPKNWPNRWFIKREGTDRVRVAAVWVDGIVTYMEAPDFKEPRHLTVQDFAEQFAPLPQADASPCGEDDQPWLDARGAPDSGDDTA